MSDAHGVARDQLRAFIERIERLEEEKKTIADDIKDVYGEAKGMGFDTVIMKRVVALRKKDEQQRMEEEQILDTYLHALGMLDQPDFFHEAPTSTREDRAKKRTSEAMADHKSLVDEMADAGLISEEARHENKALADAVATKFGNGPAKALQSPRKAAEAVSERTAVQVEDHSSAEATIEGQPSETVATRAESAGEAYCLGTGLPTNSPSDDDAIAEVNGSAGLANVIDVEPSSSVQIDPTEDRSEGQSLDGGLNVVGANTGGSDVDGSAERADTSNTAGGTVSNPPAKSIRPNCLRPDNCGGYGSHECWSCRKNSEGASHA